MSRIAKKPIIIPNTVSVKIDNQKISVQGKNGITNYLVPNFVKVIKINNKLFISLSIKKNNLWAIAGTVRALLNNIIIGIDVGFYKKLYLVGIGYKVVVKNNILNLFLGYSHFIKYKVPKGIFVNSPVPTEIILTGNNKQLVNQVSAKIRSYRVPEPYKNKGIRYENEILRVKEIKKKS